MACSTARCFPIGWQFVHNLVSFPGARIIFGWDSSLFSVSLISCSNQLITLSVEDLFEHKSFFVTVVYGLNLARERLSLWNDLRQGGAGSNKSRLDKVLVNDHWLELFRDAEVVGHAPGVSDHCALVLSFVHKRFRVVPFRFYNFWMNNGGFKDLLALS
ncbi:hypothetical protein RHMOL_Rhmol01G0032100 [Rhododendron molle]|uniref:Uncharacterized protein n=1 Tax=Rhododendron molle TaxID=49168 RepID=A0ACC0PXF0_RHOML|nr:hypothetical protein RHMOL_Rhmol01G0032100 [Rhododendron molle]